MPANNGWGLPVVHGRSIGYKGDHYYTRHACIVCGKERWVALRGGDRLASQMCKDCRTAKLVERNKSMLGQKCQNWKGGRRINNKGYVFIRVHPNDFFCSMTQKSGYALEHRLIMAQYLKRPLMNFEEVHHRNGIKTDNRLENLDLVIHTDHFGFVQCPHCTLKFKIK